LTDPQQERIRQINAAVIRSLQDIERQWRGGRHELTQQRMAVLDDARRQVLEILTDQQRALWEELMAEEQ
jgi:hypothetical protein